MKNQTDLMAAGVQRRLSSAASLTASKQETHPAPDHTDALSISVPEDSCVTSNPSGSSDPISSPTCPETLCPPAEFRPHPHKHVLLKQAPGASLPLLPPSLQSPAEGSFLPSPSSPPSFLSPSASELPAVPNYLILVPVRAPLSATVSASPVESSLGDQHHADPPDPLHTQQGDAQVHHLQDGVNTVPASQGTSKK